MNYLQRITTLSASLLGLSLLAYTGPPNAICTRQTYTISLPTYSAIAFSPSIDTNPNQTVVTALIQDWVSNTDLFTATYQSGTNAQNGTHQLSGVLCVPKAGDKHPGVVQMLVHGIGFDSSYWDFSYKPELYSYVEAAANAGYTTFRYDRLGTGTSEHPADAYRTVQAATDLGIILQFASLLRSGGIGDCAYSKIVGIGHSYGSVQLAALSAVAPQLLDALVLTGYSGNISFWPQFLTSNAWSLASSVFPSRFASLPGGYLATGLPQTSQMNFFYYPYFEEGAIKTARATEQPVSQGVLFSLLDLGGSSKFSGPVHLVTGAQDWVFCGAQCNSIPPGGNLTILELTGPTVFPMSESFSVYSPPNTGHGTNMHLSTPNTYAEMLGWIQGLEY